ncbi:MAG: hypothetical protein P8Y14_06305 [Anaerolineales bacterium]
MNGTEDPLHQVAQEALRSQLGRGGQVNWIDRSASSAADLKQKGQLVITGRMKVGKTREAIELIRRAVAEGLVPKERIFIPGWSFIFSNLESFERCLNSGANQEGSVLVFLDELPLLYGEDELERLGISLDFVSSLAKQVYVLATARSDQLRERHKSWLEQRGIEHLNLIDLDGEQAGRLIDSAAGVYDLQVEDAARKALIKGRDGTPELTLTGLRRYWLQGEKQVTGENVKDLAKENLIQSWSAARQLVEEKYPETGCLLRALADFHAVGILPDKDTVLDYANHIWKQTGEWGGSWRSLNKLEQALSFLDHLDVAIGEDRVHYPDVLVEGVAVPEEAHESLGAFLDAHTKGLRNRALRGISGQGEARAMVLYKLGNRLRQRAYPPGVGRNTTSPGGFRTGYSAQSARRLCPEPTGARLSRTGRT